MPVQKFSLADAVFERSPGQSGGVFTANLVDQRHGGPVTVGFGRYDSNQSLTDTIAVYDTMVVLEGRLSVTANGETATAGPGEIVYMPKGETVTIRAHEEGATWRAGSMDRLRPVTIRAHKEGATTAYVTYPHWQEAAD